MKGRIITTDEIQIFNIPGPDGADEIECVAYVADVQIPFDEDADASSLTCYDAHRGIVKAETLVCVRKDAKARTADARFVLENVTAAKSRTRKRNMMELATNDEEIVPVKKGSSYYLSRSRFYSLPIAVGGFRETLSSALAHTRCARPLTA